MKMGRDARKVLLALHRYGGLVCGAVLAITGLSGSILVFGHEIDRALNPELLVVVPGTQPLPLDEVVREAQLSRPGDELDYIFPPRGGDESCEMVFDDLSVHLNPYTGAVLGERERAAGFVGTIRGVHTTLLMQGPGRWVLAGCAAMLIVLGISGVALGWPGWRRLWSAWVIRWAGRWKARNFHLHRALGFWSLPLLLLSVVTGLTLLFPGPFNRLGAGQSRQGPASEAAAVAGNAGGLEGMLHSAQIISPGATTRVSLTADTVTIRQKSPNELHPNGMSFIQIDRETGRVLSARLVADDSAMQTAANLRFPLHIGVYGGLFSRVLHCMAGLMPAILWMTGVLIWWWRR